MSADLRSRYLGLELRNPIVAAASPMTGSLDNLKRLEDAGIAAVVLPSLFEEQIEHEEMATHNLMLSGTELSPEARGFFPEMQNYNTGPDQYLKLIAEAKRTLAVPVIPEPERPHAGRLDAHRQTVRAGRRRRDRTQCLFPRHRPGRYQRGGGEALCRPGGLGAQHGFDTGRGESVALLQRHGQYGGAARGGRRLGPGAVQPLLAARHCARRTRGDAAPRAVHFGRTAPGAALDRHPARAHQGEPGRHRRRAYRGGRAQTAARRRRLRHGREQPVAQRAQACRHTGRAASKNG